MSVAARQLALRALAVASGNCSRRCGRPAKPGGRWCQACLDLLRAWRQMNLANGLCACGNAPRPQRKTCPSCAAGLAKAHARRLVVRFEAGLCSRCPAPVEPGRHACKVHLDAAKVRVAAWEARQAHPRKMRRRVKFMEKLIGDTPEDDTPTPRLKGDE